MNFKPNTTASQFLPMKWFVLKTIVNKAWQSLLELPPGKWTPQAIEESTNAPIYKDKEDLEYSNEFK